MKTKYTFTKTATMVVWIFISFGSGMINAQSFEAISLSGVTDVPTASRSANFIDVNGDGWDDIFITNGPSQGQNNMLFLNNQDGTFEVVSNDPIVMDNDRSDGASFADADNDGDLDAMVVTFGGGGQGKKNYFYRNSGNGTFSYEPSIAMGVPLTYSEMTNWVDLNNDQNLDVFVTNSVGSLNNLYFENQGDTTFEAVTSLALTQETLPSRSIDWIDYDGDGDNDIFITNEEGSKNSLFRNDGANAFTQITNLAIVQGNQNSAGSSWGDIDNDGDYDLFVANYGNTGQANQLFINDNGTFTEVTTSEIAAAVTNSFGSSFGDLDNDGDLDLLVCNAYLNSQTTNFIYMNDGAGNFTLDTTSALSMHQGWTFGAAFGDYDNDGWLDVLLANNLNDNQANALFRNTGTGNNWITLNLKGVESNASAVGAVVKIRAVINGSETWQTRHIAAASGYCSQNSFSVHFGLGDATQIDEVQVLWPSGMEEIFTAVSTNQIRTVVEGENSLGLQENQTLQLQLYPNPVDSVLYVDGLSPLGTYSGSIKIYNTDGKLMKEQSIGTVTNFQINVSTLAAGMYFYTLQEGPKSMTSGKFIKK